MRKVCKTVTGDNLRVLKFEFLCRHKSCHDLRLISLSTDRFNFKHWRFADIVKALDFGIVRPLVAVG